MEENIKIIRKRKKKTRKKKEKKKKKKEKKKEENKEGRHCKRKRRKKHRGLQDHVNGRLFKFSLFCYWVQVIISLFFTPFGVRYNFVLPFIIMSYFMVFL